MTSITSLRSKPVWGQVREDGYTFKNFDDKGYEVWVSPDAVLRHRWNTVYHHAKKRCEKSGVPFDITKEYIASIFPEDYICPVLGIKMEFGGGNKGRDNSPSLDRKIPHKGYVPGNLRWISNRANTLKRDASIAELEAVVAYIKSIHAQETN